MRSESVTVICDVYCEWEGEPPNYRVYVDDEMFGERTWVWNEYYLEERLQIHAPAGKYQIRYELVPPFTGNIRAENIRVERGPPGSRIIKNRTLRITSEST